MLYKFILKMSDNILSSQFFNYIYLPNKEIISLSGESFDEEIQKEEKNLMARVTNFFFGS